MTTKHECYASIHKKATILGVPVTAAIVYGMASGIMILNLKTLWVLPISTILYMLIAFMYSLDPFFPQIIVRHLKTKSFYNP